MKKILLLLLCTATLGLASCKKDNIIQDTPNRTILLPINPEEWKSNPDGSTYTATKMIPEIDQLSIDIEGILVYLDHPTNVNSNIQLPYVFGGVSYSYEQFKGGISIDIQKSEFSSVKPKAPTVKVFLKVVLIPSKDVT